MKHYAEMIANRIGHFAINTELFLCQVDAGRKASPDAYLYKGSISNWQLALMWERALPIATEEPAEADVVESLYDISSDMDTDGLLERSQPHIWFTDVEMYRGLVRCNDMGIDGPFVCVQCRDAAYHDIFGVNDGRKYHDFRNVDIADYEQGMEALADMGYHVIRMGQVVAKPLKTEHPRIHDYATRGRDDFMDIWLPAHCDFMWSTGSGIDAISAIFRRPILFTDYMPPGRDLNWPHTKTYTKHVSDTTPYLCTEDYEKNGVTYSSMTSEELTLAVTEFARGL